MCIDCHIRYEEKNCRLEAGAIVFGAKNESTAIVGILDPGRYTNISAPEITMARRYAADESTSAFRRNWSQHHQVIPARWNPEGRLSRWYHDGRLRSWIALSMTYYFDERYFRQIFRRFTP